MEIPELLSQNEEQCKGAVSAFKRELQKTRSGRASTGLVEGIMVDYYGSRTQLSHLGQITTPEARVIMIQVFDSGAIEAVEKALISSELGFNPSRDGNNIRITIQPLTEETRKDLVKVLHKGAEDIRISIRNHRREANDLLKKGEKDGELTKDDVKRGLDLIQKQTDQYIKEVDTLLAEKEAEVLEV